MKKIFRLIPAALALVALASCSNDDVFTEKLQTVAGADELIIEVDPLEYGNETRAFRNDKGNDLTFVKTDKINVYDKDLYKFDRYVFDGKSKFVIDGTKYGIAPKYALFPSGDVVRGYWDHETNLVSAEFKIPEIITYTSASEKTDDGKLLYAANLPMFGYAETNGDGVKVTNLRHLVAVLKLEIKNAFMNANWLRLTTKTGKKLTGTFKATLNPDPEKRKDVKLAVGGADLIVNDVLYVDLRNVPSEKSVVYIPIVPGLDGDVDGIQLDYAKVTNSNPKTIAAVDWYDTGCKFPSTTFTQNKLIEAGYDFTLGASTPNEVTKMLAQYAPTAASDIIVNLDKQFWTQTSKAGAGTTFTLPATKDGVNIQINLTSSFTAWNGGDIITFNGSSFKGKVTFNVNSKLTASQIKGIVVNTPNADVVLAGDFSKQTGKVTLTAAKSVSIGNGSTTTTFNKANLGFNNVVNVAQLNIAAKATVTDNITTTNISTNVDVKGQVVGNIDMSKSVKGKLTLTAAPGAETDKVVDGDVTTNGDVEIALTKPGEAISGTLTMQGAKKTVTLSGGYVNTIDNKVNNSGTWEDKDINLVLSGDVPTEVLTMKETNGPINLSGETKWNGNKITNATYADKKTTFKSANDVFTAAQLATLSSLADINLLLNIDLNNKNWTSVDFSTAGTINGNNKIIKNLKKEPLLGTISKKLTVKNLKIYGANLDGRNIDCGALGRWSSKVDLDINGLEIKDLQINPYKLASGALGPGYRHGGVLGTVVATSSNTIKLTNVTVTGEIDCFKEVGGLIGTIQDGNTTFKNCKSTVIFKQSYESGKSMTMDYAKIGGFVGTVISGGNITIDGGSATAPKHAHAAQEFLSDTTVDAGDFYSFTAQQPFIGFCGAKCGSSAVTIGTVKIGTTTYKVPDFKTKNGDGWTTCTPLYDFATQKKI